MGVVARSAAGAALVGTAALWGWARPTYDAHPDTHDRPFGEQEQRLIRPIGPMQSPSLASSSSGSSTIRNPGIRAVTDFLTHEETRGLMSEVQQLKKSFGINLISPMHAALYRFQMSYLRPPIPAVNMMRVTARPEAEGQQLPKWGYGDDLKEQNLPPKLKALVKKVRSIPGLNLGPLRDVTLNYRHSHFFRLDPHVDPQLDGENVFIIGLDSDTVLTFCPLNYWKLTRWLDTAWALLTLEDERDLVKRQANGRSWTSLDLDVLMKKGTLVLMSGDSRWSWTHGARLGVQVPGSPGLHDWWGSPDSVVPRNHERHSVVLAFGKGTGS